MNNDRELLELAAKAAGYKREIHPLDPEPHRPAYWIGWNPLTDDGDALRLAVKCKMCVDCVDGSMIVEFFVKDKIKFIGIEIDTDGLNAATRRAIVRAAAEIGKGLK